MDELGGAERERRKPPTLRDVAEVAKVSKQTISRVINNKGEVHPATRKRVLEVIREMGYQPNVFARSLVTNRSSAIGLILPDISQPFYPEIARGVEDKAQAAGYSVFLCNVAGSIERELQALDRLRGHRTAGLIICNSRLTNEELAKAVDGPSPVVLVNRRLEGVSSTVIWTGYYSGSLLAVNHLISLGRTKIAYLGMAGENRFQTEKLEGYRDGLNQAGLPFLAARVELAPSTLQGGFRAMQALIEKHVEVDAVCAFNDHMAVGALRFAAVHGLKVPDDLAIIGFGGSEITAMTAPSLSTISVPLYDIGATAVAKLLDLIESGNEEDQQQQVHAQPHLVIRASTSGFESESIE